MVAGSLPSLEPFGLVPSVWSGRGKWLATTKLPAPHTPGIPVLNLVLAHVFCVMTQYPETMEDCVLAESLGQV